MKSLIIWGASIVLLIIMMMSEFSAYYQNPSMLEILNSIPQAMLDAFSMTGANLTTVGGYVSMASFYFYLLLGIYAVLLGSGIISKEERDKTVEFLMSLPVSRFKVVLSKLVAAVILCIGINVILFGTIYATTMQYDKLPGFNKYMLLMMISLFIVEMIFMSIGMLLAAMMKRYKKSGNYSLSILLGLYVLSILIGLSDKLDKLKYLTPFKYFESSTILHTGTLEATYVWISIGIVAVALFGAFMIYPKRDLHI